MPLLTSLDVACKSLTIFFRGACPLCSSAGDFRTEEPNHGGLSPSGPCSAFASSQPLLVHMYEDAWSGVIHSNRFQPVFCRTILAHKPKNSSVTPHNLG